MRAVLGRAEFLRAAEIAKLAQGFGEGTLEAAALDRKPVQQSQLPLSTHTLHIDRALANFQASQFPVSYGHLLDKDPFGWGAGLPLGFERGAKLLVVGLILAGDEETAGAQAMLERVHAHSGFTFRSSGPGGLQSIAPVCFYLFHASHGFLNLGSKLLGEAFLPFRLDCTEGTIWEFAVCREGLEIVSLLSGGCGRRKYFQYV